VNFSLEIDGLLRFNDFGSSADHRERAGAVPPVPRSQTRMPRTGVTMPVRCERCDAIGHVDVLAPGDES
jgi:hypothetical protein